MLTILDLLMMAGKWTLIDFSAFWGNLSRYFEDPPRSMINLINWRPQHSFGSSEAYTGHCQGIKTRKPENEVQWWIMKGIKTRRARERLFSLLQKSMRIPQVVTWGDADSGGDSRAVKEQLQKVQWWWRPVFGLASCWTDMKRSKRSVFFLAQNNVKTNEDSWG